MITHAVDSLFGCPIYVNEIVGQRFDQVQAEIANVLPDIVKNLTGSENYLWDKGRNGNQLNLGVPVNVIDQYGMQNTQNMIFDCVVEYLNKINGVACTFKIVDSWMVEMNKGDYLGRHNHGLSHISGVYYYSAEPDSGDLIVFPQGSQTVHPFPAKFCKSPFHAPSVHYKPQTGKIVMFPGWADHCVTESQNSNLRYSMPFNIMLTEI